MRCTIPPATPSLSRPARALLLLAFAAVQFCPWLHVPDMLFPFIAPGNLLFRAVVGTVALVVVLVPVCGSPGFGHRAPLDGLIAGTCLVTLISAFAGINPAASLWGGFERMGGAVSVLNLAAYYFLLTRLVRSPRQWTALFNISIFTALVMTIMTLPPLYELRGHRVSGLAGNPMHYAGHLLLNLVLSLAIAFPRRGGADAAREIRYEARVRLALLMVSDLVAAAWFVIWHPGGPGVYQTTLAIRPQAAILFLLLHVFVIAGAWSPARLRIAERFPPAAAVWFLFVLCLTQTRGSLVAAVAAAGFALLPSWRRNSDSRGTHSIRRGIIGATAALAAGGFAVLALGATDLADGTILRRMANLPAVGPSVMERIEVWRTAMRAFAARPLLGWGPENFDAAVDSHMRASDFPGTASGIWVDRAHSLLFQTAVTTGAAGLLMLATLHVRACRLLLRSGEALPATGAEQGGPIPDPVRLCALVIAYDVHAMVGIQSIHTDILLFTVFAYAAGCGRPPMIAAGDVQAIPESRGLPVSSSRISVVVSRFGRPLTRVAVAGFIVALLWTGCIEPWRAARRLARANRLAGIVLRSEPDAALVTSGRSGPEEVSRLFGLAVAGRFTGRDEIRREYANHVLELSADVRVAGDYRIAELRRMFDELERGIAENPNRASDALFLALITNEALESIHGIDPRYAFARAARCLEVLARAERINDSRPEISREREKCLQFLRTHPDQAASDRRGFYATDPESESGSGSPAASTR